LGKSGGVKNAETLFTAPGIEKSGKEEGPHFFWRWEISLKVVKRNNREKDSKVKSKSSSRRTPNQKTVGTLL